MDWFFPVNDGGEYHGIGDSGIDLFKGEPVKSLTREICQNSIDARANDTDPVRVEFQLTTVPLDRIPGHERLKEYFMEAQQFCEQQDFAKAKRYFEKSIPILSRDEIPVLRISDFNTSGLPGATKASTDFTTKWFRLVRSVGSSDKSDGSIGAFGSGKKAAFACSELQTVFYSTYVEEEGYAYQGVTKLIGFVDSNQLLHSDIGYYCEQKSLPVLDEFSMGDGFARSSMGTDVYVVGFKFGQQEWKKQLIAAVLDGFFYAIKENHLIVDVGDVSINAETIPDLIEMYKDDIDERTYDYYKLMTSDKATERVYSCMSEDDVIIRMIIEPGLHKRVAIIRYPGMKVFDKGQISTTIPFAGICVIKGVQIAKLLGGMENIQHNKWELSRYDEDPDTQKDAKDQRDRVYKLIRDLFTELRGQDTEGELDPEIGDCLPDPVSENEERAETLADNILEISKAREITVKPASQVEIEDEDGEPSEDGDGFGGTGGGPGPDPEPGPGPGPGPDPGPGPGPDPGPNPPYDGGGDQKKPAKPVKAAIMYTNIDYSSGKYRIWITPKTDVNDGRVDIFMGAETDSYKAEIIEALVEGSPAHIEGHRITGINLRGNNEAIIDIKLNYSDMCSLEVRVYGY